jgi:regulator of sirC expression with transglutaminase-like and TPR domain
MFRQREAIVRLLLDDDPTTVELTRRQLLAGGMSSVPDLLDLMSDANTKLAGTVRDLITEIEVTDAKDQFTKACQSIASMDELERICWLLSRVFLPGLNLNHYIKLLDQWGAELRDLKQTLESEADRDSLLPEFFGNQLGFQGNSDDYYNIRNLLLPCIIDSKRGIPTSLALVYLLVSKRADLAVTGVDLPGHFVIRYHGHLFDPFERGYLLTEEDCLRALVDQRTEALNAMSTEASPKTILIHLLSNLLYILEQEEKDDYRKLISAWLAMVKES